MPAARYLCSTAPSLARAVATTIRSLIACVIAGLTLALPVASSPTVSASPATAPPRSEELHAAKSAQADDLKGWETSLYRGTWWRPQYAEFRECVMRRESHFNYTAKNRTSSASGAYQFLDKRWRRGLVYMMLAESRRTNDGLVERIKPLFKIPISQWDRYFQDRAFYTAYAHGKGAAHWAMTCPR